MALRPERPVKPHPRDLTVDRTLETWETWVDVAIRDARERGDFNDLSGSGQPLKLDRNPFAGDRELGFHVLKNAELLPRWMELDRELSWSRVALDRYRDQSVERLARLRRQVKRQVDKAEASTRKAKHFDWVRGSERYRCFGRRLPDRGDVERERQHARRQYLERAAALDKLILEYNQALPDEIRWLERARVFPEEAAARFDATCARLDPEDGDPETRI